MNTETRNSTPDESTRISQSDGSPFASQSTGAFATPASALDLVCGNREERHAGRLVRVRAPAEDRAVEEARLEHERVVEHEMPRQLVARAVLRPGEADRRQRRKRDQREHERLEPVPAESHGTDANRVCAADVTSSKGRVFSDAARPIASAGSGNRRTEGELEPELGATFGCSASRRIEPIAGR